MPRWNGPLDDWVRRHTGAAFDADGALALAGQVDPARLAMLLQDPYFARPAPKSLDRLHFAARIAAATEGLSPEDGAATLAAFTASAIAAAPLPHPPGAAAPGSAKPLRVLVCGGGRRNPAIMAGLSEAFAVSACAAAVEPVEAVGWNGDALEAQCFGFLAARVRRGLPLSLPSTTGVPYPCPGGRIVEPR